jgi:nucleotide-binding universal stress UspA family protein
MISANSSTNQTPFKTASGLPPYSRILVPLDGSKMAEEALPVAIAFAQRAGTDARLLLVRVGRAAYAVYSRGGPFEVSTGGQEEIAAYLTEIEQEIKAQKIPVEVVCPEGEPALAIVDVARDHFADLIVMVTHSREGMSRLIHGSVADRVLQGTTVPVLLLKHGEEPGKVFSSQAHPHLLVPLDGSELAESVLGRVISLATQLRAPVALIRSLDLPDLTAGVQGRAAASNDMVRVIVPTERKTATQYLEQVQQLLQAQGIPTAVVVTEGGAALDIAEQAKVLNEAGEAVMIVMATHGRTGLSRWLYGSVAGAVLHLVEAPLLVIRPR